MKHRWSRGALPLVGIALTLLIAPAANAQDVVVRSDTQLRQALANARAGTRIFLAPGTYSGGLRATHLQGTASAPILIASLDPRQRAVVRGGGQGIHLVRPAHVEIREIIFRGATHNGINIDDGGAGNPPAHHIMLRRVTVEDVGPFGNRDGIKLSGVTDFIVRGARIIRWGDGGSAIDMVGCHRGIVEAGVIRHENGRGGTGVQVKGGSSDVLIRRVWIQDAGHRAINIGGTTGSGFFRPQNARAEATNITVEGNIIIGAQAAVAFVGADRSTVRYNTIYRPQRWVMRILQENTRSHMVPSRNGFFHDNIVLWRSNELRTWVNVGPNTAPETFRFQGNFWLAMDRPSASRPSLPTAERNGIYGLNPLMVDMTGRDFRLLPGSPAAGKGFEAEGNWGSW